MSDHYTDDDIAREEAALDRLEHGRFHDDIERGMVIDLTERCVLHARFLPNSVNDGQCPKCCAIDALDRAANREAIRDAEWDYRHQFDRH